MTEAEYEYMQAFSKRMHKDWHTSGDPFLRERCKVLHENAQRMLNGQDSPELRAAFKKNLDDLAKYKAGAYNDLIGILQ